MSYDLDFVGPLREGESPPLKQYHVYQPEYEAWLFAAEYRDRTRGGKLVRTRWKDTPERWARHFDGGEYKLVDRELRRMGGPPKDHSTPPSPHGPAPVAKRRPTKTLTRNELQAIKRRLDPEDILVLLWDIAILRAAVVRIYELASVDKPYGSLAADADPIISELRKLSCVLEHRAKQAGY